MRLVVDTGVFSAALSRRRRPELESYVARLAGNQLFLAASTVAELRYGALVAEWAPRVATTTVIPVSNALLSRWADLRFACRRAGHPLADPAHTNDLWIATSATHIAAGLVSADAIFENVPGLDLR